MSEGVKAEVGTGEGPRQALYSPFPGSETCQSPRVETAGEQRILGPDTWAATSKLSAANSLGTAITVFKKQGTECGDKWRGSVHAAERHATGPQGWTALSAWAGPNPG